MSNGAFTALGAEFDKAFPDAVIKFGGIDFDPNGKQAIVRFTHNWGLSIVNHKGSYDVEAALVHWASDYASIDKFDLRENLYIENSGDVFGYLTVEELAELLFKVGNLR